MIAESTVRLGTRPGISKVVRRGNSGSKVMLGRSSRSLLTFCIRQADKHVGKVILQLSPGHGGESFLHRERGGVQITHATVGGIEASGNQSNRGPVFGRGGELAGLQIFGDGHLIIGSYQVAIAQTVKEFGLRAKFVARR